jgi:replicative DNA helicase
VTGQDRLTDLAAERKVLGYLLTHPNRADDIAVRLAPADFAGFLDGKSHTELFATILSNPGVPTDALAQASKLSIATLATLAIDGCYEGQTDHYIDRLIEAAGRRRLQHAAVELSQAATSDRLDLAGALDLARRLTEEAEGPALRALPDPDIDTFLEGDDAYDWIIPRLLERRDRWLLVADEGGGKSTLLRQIAVQAAAGISPFTCQAMDPVRVLLVDLENGERLVRRRLRALRTQCGARLDPDRLRVCSLPAGVDITERSGANWLTERVAANRPDLLIIGPMYRLYAGVAEHGDIGGEDKARKVTAAIDRVRTRFGVTVIAETHAPLGSNGATRVLRPFGSSVWLRWAEFGTALKRDADQPNRWLLTHFRMPRDERVWPVALSRGGVWPWSVAEWGEVPEHLREVA